MGAPARGFDRQRTESFYTQPPDSGTHAAGKCLPSTCTAATVIHSGAPRNPTGEPPGNK